MLTDIFAYRYEATTLWESFSERYRRLLVQGYRIVVEQLFPYLVDGKVNKTAVEKLSLIHDKLSMELGLSELAPRSYAFTTKFKGNPITHSGTWTIDKVCKDFVCADYDRSVSADQFMKERLSFFEVAFRERESDLAAINLDFPKRYKQAQRVDKKTPGLLGSKSFAEDAKAYNDRINEQFRDAVDEFNVRLRRSGCGLNYHNGFIQRSSDDTTTFQEVEKPFWSIVSDDTWKNVDIDVKEAIDRRDNNDRDPSFYAARALESTIKIISDRKGWTHGGEKGAHNFIDNLSSRKNGAFIRPWCTAPENTITIRMLAFSG